MYGWWTNTLVTFDRYEHVYNDMRSFVYRSAVPKMGNLSIIPKAIENYLSQFIDHMVKIRNVRNILGGFKSFDHKLSANQVPFFIAYQKNTQIRTQMEFWCWSWLALKHKHIMWALIVMYCLSSLSSLLSMCVRHSTTLSLLHHQCISRNGSVLRWVPPIPAAKNDTMNSLFVFPTGKTLKFTVNNTI